MCKRLTLRRAGRHTLRFQGKRLPRDGDFQFRTRSKNLRGLEIFGNLGIFICEIPGIYIPIPGDFWGLLSLGFFGDGDFSGMGIYFRRMGISHQKPISGSNTEKA